jgi:ubiquinone/menaquinone biosynthesis C-methylase UbiE
MMETNIGYWEKVLRNPTSAYKELFDAEDVFILDNVSEDSLVLDIGCGDGRNIKTILQKTKNVAGIDNDKVAIQDARKNFLDIPSVKLVKSEAVNLPFEDKTFNVVVMFDILQNLNLQKGQVFLEVKRVLEDHGKILLCTYSEDALEEREKMYEIIEVPIEKREGTKIYFDKHIGAYTSEQFSLNEIEDLAKQVGLVVSDVKKVGSLAYTCVLTKKTV